MRRRSLALWVFAFAAALTSAPAGVARANDDAITKEEARLLPDGMLDGYKAAFDVQRGGGKSHASPLTRLRVLIPSAELRMRVARHDEWSAAAESSGRIVVVKLHDAAFDAGWVASGAPSDLIRTLLDAPLRGALMKSPELYLLVYADYLEVSVARFLKGPKDVEEIVGVADLAVKHLHAGLHPVPGVALTPEQRAKELAALAAADQAQKQSNIGFIAVMGLVGFVMVGGLVYNLSRKRRVA